MELRGRIPRPPPVTSCHRVLSPLAASPHSMRCWLSRTYSASRIIRHSTHSSKIISNMGRESSASPSSSCYHGASERVSNLSQVTQPGCRAKSNPSVLNTKFRVFLLHHSSAVMGFYTRVPQSDHSVNTSGVLHAHSNGKLLLPGQKTILMPRQQKTDLAEGKSQQRRLSPRIFPCCPPTSPRL